MHVVASPIVVAVALGLLNPMCLTDEEDSTGDDSPDLLPEVLDADFASAG